jgi:hypothetical protein
MGGKGGCNTSMEYLFYTSFPKVLCCYIISSNGTIAYRYTACVLQRQLAA